LSMNALATRYAEALYEAAREAGRTHEVIEALVEVKGALDADPPAWQRLLDPRLSVEEKERWLIDRFSIDKEKLVGNALRLILRRRRDEILKVFFGVYLEVHERGEGIVRVQVETASPLTQSEQVRIWEKLEQILDKTVIVEPRVEPSLLGGLRLVVESRVVDGSLKSRLDRLKRELKGTHVA